MEELQSEQEKYFPRTAAGMSLRYKEQGLGVFDMKPTMPGEQNSSKESGGLGVGGQCLAPCLVLTTVHIEGMLLLDQTVPHPYGGTTQT